MKTFISGISAAALAAALTIAGAVAVNATPLFVPKPLTVQSDVVQVQDSMQIIRRDSLRRHRDGETHADRRDDGQILRKHRDGAKHVRRNGGVEFAGNWNGDEHKRKRIYRRMEDSKFQKYADNWDRDGYRHHRRLYRMHAFGFQEPTLEFTDSAGNWNGEDHKRKRIDRRLEDSDFEKYADNWDGDDYRHHRRLYRMKAFGFQQPARVEDLKSILTAVPD